MTDKPPIRLLIITGLSGSGKTSTVHTLEDMGFFCVDNLPILLLPGLLQLLESADQKIEKLAVVMDIRGRSFLQDYEGIFREVRTKGIKPEILFLDATTEVLLRRFGETRRPHPLSGEKTLLAGIECERERLLGLKEIADNVIDTSDFNIHQIRRYLNATYGTAENTERQLQIELISFGYPKGVPFHADMMMDVRFLPNPYWDTVLRDRDGRDAEVQRAVLSESKAREILENFFQLVETFVGYCNSKERAYFILGIGCTGGRHRSVAVVCMLEERLRTLGYSSKVVHRDIHPVGDSSHLA